MAEQVRDQRNIRIAQSTDNDEVSMSRQWVEDLDRLCARDNLTVDRNGRVLFLADASLSAHFETLTDESAIPRHIHLMREKVESDPYASIGSAKSAIESTLHHAVAVLQIKTLSQRPDMPELIKRVHSELNLHPGAVAPDAKGADAVRKSLSGLSSIALGVVELRNLYGDGHGRAVDEKRLTSRHSRLVMRSTEAYVGMILETLDAPNAPWRNAQL